MPADRQFDRSLIFRNTAVNECYVCLLNVAILKSLAQPCMCNVVLGNNKQTGCFLIEPMDNSGTERSSQCRQILEMKCQAVDKRSRFRSGPRVDHESCILLNDRQIRILKIDLERDLLRCN